MHRAISEEQARAILTILKGDCGYRPQDEREGEYFVRTVMVPRKNGVVCQEFRFMGALGFGGKLRNNGNMGNTPHVDLYPEDMTHERFKMVNRANGKIAKLFT